MRPGATGVLPVLLVLLLVPVATYGQSANARQVYSDALKREAELRREMDTHSAPDPVAPLLQRLRTLVGAYADMSRVFPNNEQADLALWQGAMLSADTFWRFGDEIDRAAALNLLDALTSRFPDSARAPQAPPHVRRLAEAPLLAPVPGFGDEPAPVRAAAPPTVEPAPRRPEPTAVASEVAAVGPPATEARAPLPVPPLPPSTGPDVRAGATSAPSPPSPPAAQAAVREIPPPAPPPVSASSPAGREAEVPAVRVAPLPAPPSPEIAASSPAIREAPPARAAPPPPAPIVPAGPARLTRIHGEGLGNDAIRFVFELEREVQVRHEQLGGPPRVVIDLRDTVPSETLTQALLPSGADVVSRIRVGRHDGSWTRIVIELRAPSRYGVLVQHDPYRVLVEVHPRMPQLSTE